MVDLSRLNTEKRNSRTMTIDRLKTKEFVQLVHQEDYGAFAAVGAAAEEIATCIDVAAKKMSLGGRLIYIGAGTSGRLGVLDASECPPTYGVSPEVVVGLIAGGDTALRTAVEGAEDSSSLAGEDLMAIQLTEHDIVCGIAASGRTPYVIGGLRFAQNIQATTFAISCVEGSEISALADYSIELLVGPEVITGSTRMKAGTATKLVLNTLTTGIMVQLGKVYSNLMINMQASNEKLIHRARQIVCWACDVDERTSEDYLQACDYHVPTAIVMHICDLNASESRILLEQYDGNIQAIQRQYKEV